MIFYMVFLVLAILCILFILFLYKHKTHYYFRFKKKEIIVRGHRKPKPNWVKREIIRIKAHMPKAGCRLIADVFNRNFAAKEMTVGKTFVYTVLRDNIYEVESLRKKWKRRMPKPMLKNIIWGMDMTGVQTKSYKGNKKGQSTTATILGILDHGTRKCISLKSISDKASITLLKALITAIESYGKPKAIRTDNESVFTSRLFRLGLWILGIRHQRTQIHSPWQNGRIERFFGTFKKYSDKVIFNTKKIQFALDEFQYWYNAIRPHRHLNGLTPDEKWEEINPYRKNPRQVKKVSFWNGLLTGYLLNYK